MYGTLGTFQREFYSRSISTSQNHYTNGPSTLISPPDSLNSGKNPSQINLPLGHGLSVNGRPPVTLACLAIRDSHLSTSTHRSSEGGRAVFQSRLSIAIDDNAGAELMEHRMFVRSGEG